MRGAVMSEGAAVGVRSLVVPRQLRAVSGAAVRIPDPNLCVHVQFRRHAGCPICNVHLQSVLRRHDEIAAAGIKEVVAFHSTDDELRRDVDELPIDVSGDPARRFMPSSASGRRGGRCSTLARCCRCWVPFFATRPGSAHRR